MFKNTNTNIKLAQYLVTYIESCDTYKNLFTHHKQQYTVQKLFEALLYKLETGISYNNINKKIVVKKRSSIEHLNNNLKQNRTINVRHESFVTLSVIKKILK